MAAELVVAPEAELDVAEAYAWYERRRIGLGEEFLSSIDACLEGIRRQPRRILSFMRCIDEPSYGAFHMPSFMSMQKRR
jgi:hypothetical protein